MDVFKRFKAWFLIPKGSYCYTIKSVDYRAGVIKTKVCPFWGRDDIHDPQDNGFCTLTGLKDWEDGTLLWDQCKECGIKN